MDGSTRDAERSAAELHLAQELGSLGLRRMHPLTIFPPPSENQMEPSNQMRSMQEKVLLFKGILKDGVVILPHTSWECRNFCGEKTWTVARYGVVAAHRENPFLLSVSFLCHRAGGWGQSPVAPVRQTPPPPHRPPPTRGTAPPGTRRSAAPPCPASCGPPSSSGPPWAPSPSGGGPALSRRGTGSGGPGSGRHSGGPEPGADGRGWAGVMEAQRPTAPSDG